MSEVEDCGLERKLDHSHGGASALKQNMKQNDSMSTIPTIQLLLRQLPPTLPVILPPASIVLKRPILPKKKIVQ